MNTSSRRIIGYNLLIMLGTGIFFRLPFWGQDVTLLLYFAPVLVAVLLAVWNIERNSG